MKGEKKEGHDPVAVANRFVEKAALAGRPLTILHLVKLVYLAHGWRLGFAGKPLISTPVQAWRHGPVIPEVYGAFREQDIYNITARAFDRNAKIRRAKLDEQEEEIVDMVYDNYAPLSAARLSALTHAEGSPWSRTKGYYALIPNDAIREYYEKRVRESRESSERESPAHA